MIHVGVERVKDDPDFESECTEWKWGICRENS